ncbi:hypothetical protein SDJN03_03674, partial [Cucurbita argyrosperma subsp. sororia]
MTTKRNHHGRHLIRLSSAVPVTYLNHPPVTQELHPPISQRRIICGFSDSIPSLFLRGVPLFFFFFFFPSSTFQTLSIRLLDVGLGVSCDY